MAISPDETNTLTEMEEQIVLTCEEKIDELLRQKWETGITCAFPINKMWRDEIIPPLITKYREKGWTVTFDPEGYRLLFSA